MKKRNTKFWFKNEKQLMKSLGLKGTPGSGNKIIKEDGQNDHLIAQLKSTDSTQITIKLADVNSLIYNATVTHKTPLFINQFVDGPILISVLLEDFTQVAEYLQTGEIKQREQIEIAHEKINAKKITSGNRTKIRNMMQNEKIKKYGRK